MEIISPDVALVCPMTNKQRPTVLKAPITPIKDSITGMAFNVYNNVWDTNYILWYPYLPEDEKFKARFSIRFTQ